MLKTKSTLTYDDLYHVYLSLEVENPTTLTGQPVKLQFVETRNNPILEDAGNWFVSIVRLNLDTWSLPIYIPQVQLGQANPNLTSYVVTVRYGGVNSQQTILWTPENLQATVPPAPISQQHIVDNYYYGNSYEHLVNLINTALLNAYTPLAGAIAAGLGAVPAGALGQPFLIYDGNQIVANLYGLQQYYDQNVGLVGPVEVYFNSALYSLLNSLPSEFYSNPTLASPALASGMDYKITMKSFYSKNLYNFPVITAPVAPAPTGAYVVAYQQFPTLGILNPVDSIVLTSNLLPINPSLVSRPRVYGGFSSSASGTGSNNANVTSILVDFVPSVAYGYETKKISYTPSAEYKLVDLVGPTQRFSQIDLNAFWKDNFGNLHPIYLNQGSNGSILIMFRKKSFEGLKQE